MDYWYVIIVIPILMSLINVNHWYFLRDVMKQHNDYIKGFADKISEEEKIKSKEAADWLTGNLTEIKRRIERTGIDIPTKSYMEPAGYGYLGQQNINVIDNLLLKNTEILQQARYTIELAKEALNK